MPGPFARRTEHPYLVDSLADLPADLRQLAEQTLEPNELVDTIFVVPPQTMPKNIEGRGGMHRVPEQAILFAADRILHVQAAEKPGAPGQAPWITTDQLFYVRLILILLYGRLELYGVDDGALKRIIVEYNTVAHELLQPALQRFLCRAWRTGVHVEGIESDHTESLLQELGQQSFKFGNGLPAYGLLPGAKLTGFVFQPRLVQRIWRIFQHLVAPAALLALTDGELVIIEEGRTNATSYGWFITLCPRVYVARIEIGPGARQQDIHVYMSRGISTAAHQVTMESKAAQGWMSLWLSKA